jgi:hypothetical protein
MGCRLADLRTGTVLQQPTAFFTGHPDRCCGSSRIVESAFLRKMQIFIDESRKLSNYRSDSRQLITPHTSASVMESCDQLRA